MVAAVQKVDDPAVFKKSVHDADNPDIFTESFESGAEAADPSDVEVDLDTSGRSFIESIDDCRINQRIQFGKNFCPVAVAGPIGFHTDHLDDSIAKTDGSHL